MAKFDFTASDASPVAGSKVFTPEYEEDSVFIEDELVELQASVVEIKKFVEDRQQISDQFEYLRSGSDPGLVVIFNQQKFEDAAYKERFGTNRDVNEMILTFGRLGFNVDGKHIHTNLTRKEILKELDALSNEDYTDKNSLIVVVLTHGDKDDSLQARDGLLKTYEIWEPFSMNRCPSLKNKPKFFIFQACKGASFSEHNATKGEVIPNSVYTAPMEPDMLIAFAAVEGSQSYRHMFNGTWFIQELCRNFAAFGRRDDVISLLIRTTKCVANNYYHISDEMAYTQPDSRVLIKKQMPLFVSTLTKKFYLNKSKDRLLMLHMLKQQNEILKTLQDVQRKVDIMYEDFQGNRRQKRNK